MSFYVKSEIFHCPNMPTQLCTLIILRLWSDRPSLYQLDNTSQIKSELAFGRLSDMSLPICICNKCL